MQSVQLWRNAWVVPVPGRCTLESKFFFKKTTCHCCHSHRLQACESVCWAFLRMSDGMVHLFGWPDEMPPKFREITTWTSQEAFGSSDRSSSLHFWGRGAECVASSFSDPRPRKLGCYTGYACVFPDRVENYRKSGPIKSTFTNLPIFQRFLRPEDLLWWGRYLR